MCERGVAEGGGVWAFFFFFFFFKSSGEWVKLKLKLPHFHVSDKRLGHRVVHTPHLTIAVRMVGAGGNFPDPEELADSMGKL